MRLRSFLKGLFIFGLVLFLGVSLPFNNMLTAYADTQDIKLNVNSQTIVKGKTFSIYVYNLSEGQEVTFVSSDPAIASVDENGTVSGNLIGTATILVTVTEGENTVDTLSCDIKVGPPAIDVRFSRLELAMKVGQKLTLERIILPLNAVENAKFSTYDRTIATVSAGGRVTAKTEGSTYIFAQLDNGRFAVCKVTIYPTSIADDVFDALVKETLRTVVIPAEKTTSPEDLLTEAAAPETSDSTLEEPSKARALDTEASEAQEDVTSETSSEVSSETGELSADEPAYKEISDPFLIHNNDMDFETFIKKLNAALKSSETANSVTENAETN